MKALVMTAIIAVAGLVNVIAINAWQQGRGHTGVKIGQNKGCVELLVVK